MSWTRSIFLRQNSDDSRRVSRKGGSEDVVLFARFLEGDDQAFMELFHRHTPRLYVYCLKIVGDEESAQDIVQDVWERIARFRSQEKDVPKSPLGLLIRITRNLCLNHKRDRRPKIPLDDVQPGKEPQVFHNNLTEMEEAVIVGLDHLPEAQRELLVLYSYSGYSYEELAEMYDDTVGAIRTRAWRARVKLGRLIAALMEMGQDAQEDDGSYEKKSDEAMMYVHQMGRGKA